MFAAACIVPASMLDRDRHQEDYLDERDPDRIRLS